MRRSWSGAVLAGLTVLLVGVAAPGAGGADLRAGPSAARDAVGVGPASAGPVIAPLVANVPIAAGGGWVVWSVPVADGWGLEAWHGGVTRSLGVAVRAQPFDVNVGSGARGEPVVAFSRCAAAPPAPAIGLGFLDPLSGRGCRAHVVDLASGRESTPAIPHPAGTSDTTPSMWRGRVAFARLDPSHHGQVEQVLLWTPGQRGLRSLPHGALPSRCGLRGGCAGQPRTGSVEGLSYDGRLVGFLWRPVAPGVDGQAAWEVRTDTVSTGASRVVGDGVAGEVCTGGSDLSAPSPPLLRGSTVRFASLQATCYVFNSLVSQLDVSSPGNGSYAPLPGVVLGLAQDGDQLYAVQAPVPAGETNPTCTTSAPCQIELLPPPGPVRPEPHRPTSPFF